MRVHELLREEDRKIWADKVKNAANIGEISRETTEKQYRVKSVIFDNISGLGRVPDNANVLYKGFTAIMSVDDFLAIAADHANQRDESAAEIYELIKQGYGIATPWLVIDVDDIKYDNGTKAICSGHEGRARAICVKKYFGLTEIPVHIFPAGLRARDMSQSIVDVMNKNGVKKQGSTSIIKNAFKKVFI